ncbi:MAG: tail fiber protein [Bacteroidota bacterium]
MEPFIGQIMMFGGNFAPRGWALCNGQLLPINQNQALFSILGTTYGGDGRTTFQLPDLRGRYAMHAGRGPGLSQRNLGAEFGSETNTLNVNQLPSHNHLGQITGNIFMPVSANPPDTDSPNAAYLTQQADDFYHTSPSPNEFAGPTTNDLSAQIGNTGANQSINNIQPTQVVNYIIALQGIFPSRS